MEFNFNCEEALDCDQNGFAILEGTYKNRILPGFILFVTEILDKMGLASSQSQNLTTISTSFLKFYESNHRIVIKAQQNKVLGFIKVGTKKLYVRDRYYNYHNVSPLCVIDFYVHESCQRNGIGKQLFDYMVNFERKYPEELAYENPSNQLINFLQKHYNLVNFVEQNNNYIVYDEFFNHIQNNLTNDNSTFRQIRAISGKPNSNNYNINDNYDNYNYDNNNNINNNNMDNNINNNNNFNNDYNNEQNYQQNDYNVSRSQNINRMNTPIVNAGQNLVYNNAFDNNVIDKSVYKEPYYGFKKYFFKGGDTLSHDNIYSKKKINMINDYLNSNTKSPNEYLKEQFNYQENSIANSNGRLNQLMNKISDLSPSIRYDYDQLYNKRNQFATVFDDKKIVENNYYSQRYNNEAIKKGTINRNEYRNSTYGIIDGKQSPLNLQSYSPFSRFGKVYTNILPTTSSNYGNYYNSKDLKFGEQFPNKLYY